MTSSGERKVVEKKIFKLTAQFHLQRRRRRQLNNIHTALNAKNKHLRHLTNLLRKAYF